MAFGKPRSNTHRKSELNAVAEATLGDLFIQPHQTTCPARQGDHRHVMRNPNPGAITKPGELSSAKAIPINWNKARPNVP